MKPTKRLYWEDDHILTADGVVLDVREHSVAVDQTLPWWWRSATGSRSTVGWNGDCEG